jgi:hypothetical protein
VRGPGRTGRPVTPGIGRPARARVGQPRLVDHGVCCRRRRRIPPGARRRARSAGPGVCTRDEPGIPPRLTRARPGAGCCPAARRGPSPSGVPVPKSASASRHAANRQLHLSRSRVIRRSGLHGWRLDLDPGALASVGTPRRTTRGFWPGGPVTDPVTGPAGGPSARSGVVAQVRRRACGPARVSPRGPHIRQPIGGNLHDAAAAGIWR